MPRLTVVVNFFDMVREAPRTLHSLTPGYQGVDAADYEVVAVDNGSRRPLDPAMVASFGPNFRHVAFEPEWPSPAAALNHAVAHSDGARVMLCIDGARILSPGILRSTDRAFRAFDNPFVYTLGMHLGRQVQNQAIAAGWTQADEDALLRSVDWEDDGYELYRIATVAPSSKEGFFSDLAESNCVALSRAQYERMGGYDEAFRSPGGGLVNLDVMNRARLDPSVDPVMLLGEATFHQMHGGVATNSARNPDEVHPFGAFAAEYERI
ncbi:MAG: glycosyltransferase family 2 protein, partial [Acidimicrobiales bacterium]|nr:glycosyltransferase family 2 protein [Acidimicrobiales bacterium]